MESERSLSKARQNKRSHIPSDVTYKYTKKAIRDLCSSLPSGHKINESLSGYFMYDHEYWWKWHENIYWLDDALLCKFTCCELSLWIQACGYRFGKFVISYNLNVLARNTRDFTCVIKTVAVVLRKSLKNVFNMAHSLWGATGYSPYYVI